MGSNDMKMREECELDPSGQKAAEQVLKEQSGNPGKKAVHDGFCFTAAEHMEIVHKLEVYQAELKKAEATIGLSESRLRRAELVSKTGNWE